MSEALVKFLGEVAVALSPLVVAAVGALAAYLAKLIKAKVESQLLAAGLVRINDAIFVVVKELMQTLASEFRARAADGKLSDEDKAVLKRVAMDKLKSYVNLAELSRLYGLGSEKAAEELLASKVEAAVADVKGLSNPF